MKPAPMYYSCHRQSGRTAYTPSAKTLDCDKIATHSPGLLYNGLHPRNPRNYMKYFSFTDPGGMKG